MSTLMIEIGDEAKSVVEKVARERNLSSSDFIKLAIAQSLARALNDPYLETRAARADGSGFREFMVKTPGNPPVPGDELAD